MIREGMVLNYHTSSSIDPITLKEFDKKIEKLLVLEIKGQSVVLYNLDTGKKHKEDIKFTDLYIRRGIYTITEELA